MKLPRSFWLVGMALGTLCAGHLVTGADAPVPDRAGLSLTADQKDFLTLEPILVTARLQGAPDAILPAAPGKAQGTSLRFEVTPALKARPGARPLPLEEKGADLPSAARTYDLLEWFQFPGQGGWTVQAIVEHDGTTLQSAPLQITVGSPAKDGKEQGPVSRLHHTPWSNYTTNAFCGDCFDLVKRWPDSRLARHAHYWNGVFYQNKKEYAKAVESYQEATKFPNFVLADHARYGIIECLLAQGKVKEAGQQGKDLLQRLEERPGSGSRSTLHFLTSDVVRPAAGAAQREGGTVRKD